MRKWCFLALLLFSLSFSAAQQSVVPSVILMQSQTINDVPVPQAFYRADVEGEIQLLVEFDENNRFLHYEYPYIFLEGGQAVDVRTSEIVAESYTPPPTLDIEDYKQEITASTAIKVVPLYGPYRVSTLNYYHDGKLADIYYLYAMSGETDNYVNLYVLHEYKFFQATDVLSLFPDAQQPVLSVSAEFLAFHPVQPAFLYRARLRDATGKDFNALYLYHLETGETVKMPFFGKTPVWSPDGKWLAGSRLSDGQPIYELWLVNLETSEEQQVANGCNPQFSPDGTLLAYDVHENAESQGYTDCFASGEVAAFNLDTGETIQLSVEIDKYTTLVDWIRSD